ncbi:tRNA (guanosine(37)-N1)-methyltransferase TrmD [Helicobacter mustelae]|uniref:tRNA (guanine-N(1)-)-methyltransferase n=1 Tax=Helicobacter mustelae (strain ATCC 43772 / CCUG 25715 / CIP 103759 / LMG 18044 / NCTC 12198 / R85-136P) TaxID=679897 RepID=D3UGH7_HELM1|nr:tRNA (guanosine(37)-N1)-methyltransferase TrmD [Helicobacter mustelae]CBG39598.1 tRNA (guanine-N1)-methyltransferase [Helicobacter mustelae 12198]SQH71110.1 tRNA (guanine-N1)-methyltransferase [Helicobacter mustelae]STP12238.1 tRNA (guanine-N1)-methyltransferase [Helicobacter mustelae]
MHFHFFTLFPQIIAPYFSQSILKLAKEKNLIRIQITNIRDFASPPHFKVDNAQVGGGAGQIIDLEILQLALNPIKNTHHIIFLTPCGKAFNQNDAVRLAKTKKNIALVCGRYEGFDERAIELYANEVFSIGDFILTGGELAALCLCDSIARQIPQVLGNTKSLQGESFEQHLLEAPVFSKSKIKSEKNAKKTPPSEYSKGNHSIMQDLKLDLALAKTKYFRPDLFQLWKFYKKGKR